MPSTNDLTPVYVHPPVKTQRPLRERCSVQLTVQTTLKRFSHGPVTCNMPATKVAPRTAHPEWHNFVHYDAPLECFSRSYHLEKILEGLYVAFADAHEVDTLCAEAGVPFSHVLRIEPVEDIAASGSRSEETMEGYFRTQKLTLKCPGQGRSAGYTALNASQLCAARDYLSLVMPYSSRIIPKPHPPRFNVQLLVVAPADRAVDVMSVVVCYLAFSSGYHAETVMQCIGEEEYDEVWKGVISPEGLDFVERIARVI
ncbi:hypothetical protein DEU56DRAFT_93120 [Suillus clintonianus]|uniref:uncharacterized protein n=1 Tax=Suillus clintonianus TaxID=1904413 RepID=UPI001B8749DA|nr:uncharacterized protein DEU56DRAFT_93120 [Suillus clintonianus]KAG2121751.1 hypothetical protein DEU56DRAFT_93120 [Suillus clintonianus]